MNSEDVTKVVEQLSGKLGELAKSSEPFAKEAVEHAVNFTVADGITGVVIGVILIILAGVSIIAPIRARKIKDSTDRAWATFLACLVPSILLIMGLSDISSNLPRVIAPLGYLIKSALN
jgi:hypothetical protein